MFLSVGLVGLSIFAAWYFYRKNLAATTVLAERLAPIKKLLAGKYFVDEFYGAVIIRPILYGSLFLWKVVDVLIIDGIANGSAALWHEVSHSIRHLQSGKLRNYATIFTLGAALLILCLCLVK